MPPKGKRSTTTSAILPDATVATDKDAKIRAFYKEQYDLAKAKYGPRVAVLLEVGTFYEFYDRENIETGTSDTNVRALADILGCMPTIKPSTDPLYHLLFWGFPINSLFKYESQLISASYTCVVINQTKDGGGAVRGREIDHVSSPGTYWAVQEEGENTVAGRPDEQGLVGVFIEPYSRGWQVGSARFDVTTGKITSTETCTIGHEMDSLEPFWAMFPPAEIVIWYIGESFPFKEETVLSWFSRISKRPPIHIHCISNRLDVLGASAVRQRSAFLETQFQTTMHELPSLLGLERHPTAFATVGLLLTFVQEHVPSLLTFLQSHELWNSEHDLLLGNAALEQLGMVSNNIGKPNESLLYWMQHAKTYLGKETICSRLLQPITDIEELEERQTRIASLRSLEPSKKYILDKGFRGIVNLSRIVRKVALKKANALDVLPLLLNLQQIQDLLGATKGWTASLEESIVEDLMKHVLTPTLARWSADRIREGLQEAPISGRDWALGSVHPWCRGVHPSLDALEDQWKKIQTEVHKLIEEWSAAIRSPEGIKCEIREEIPFYVTTTQKRATELLTLVRTRGFLPLTASKLSTGQMLLSCELLETANREGQGIRDQLLEAVRNQWTIDWTAWWHTVHTHHRWNVLLQWIGDLDADSTFARLADEYGYCRPVYDTTSSTSYIDCIDLRHPIIERVRTKSPYVPHSLQMGKSSATVPSAVHGMLLYGVNAAGKSSLSKAIGLSVLLAQAGIPVPATSYKLRPYKSLFTRILGNDNLWAGQSSFTVEMSEFRSILRNAGPGMLVLGDELCSGTETVSATAIVTAGIQTLVEKGAQFVFATHLHELVEMPELRALSTVVKPYHLMVRSDVGSGTLVYDRRLHPGAGSALYGLEVCRGLDMEPGFLAKAFTLRKRLEGESHESSYNATVIVSACSVCGSKKKLEVHHILPQASADEKGFVKEGVLKNRASNLVSLCSDCHDAHHHGSLHILGWMDTSAGRTLQWTRKGLTTS